MFKVWFWNIEKENPKSVPNKANPETEILILEEDIFITKEVPATGKINSSRNPKFTNEERYIILLKHMLSNDSINLTQNLRKVFQDTVIGETQFWDH